MNGGKVVQIGAPLEVYRAPADTFVAAFLGSPPMNLIAARSNSDSLHVGEAILPLRRTFSLENLIFDIRPEDIRLQSGIDGASPHAHGEVLAVEPLGAETIAFDLAASHLFDPTTHPRL